MPQVFAREGSCTPVREAIARCAQNGRIQKDTPASTCHTPNTLQPSGMHRRWMDGHNRPHKSSVKFLSKRGAGSSLVFLISAMSGTTYMKLGSPLRRTLYSHRMLRCRSRERGSCGQRSFKAQQII